MTLRRAGWTLALLCLWQGSSSASDPTPGSCSISHLIACPAGDLSIRVVVKKGKTPVAGSKVTLDFSHCAAVKFAVASPEDTHVLDGYRVSRTATDNGVAEFRVRAGGASACTRITVLADGAVIAERMAVASPDQNGDLKVDQSDLTILLLKERTSDPTADLNGDGRVDPRDLVEARRHIGHQADIATESTVRTWGEIKAGYR